MRSLDQPNHWATAALQALMQDHSLLTSPSLALTSFLQAPRIPALPPLIDEVDSHLTTLVAEERALRAARWHSFVSNSFQSNSRPLYKCVRRGPISPKATCIVETGTPGPQAVIRSLEAY